MSNLTRVVACLAFALCLEGRQLQRSCGTYTDNWREEFALHQRSRAAQPRAKLMAAGRSAVQLLPDLGNIAHLDSSDGVVARRNPFSLTGKTLRFIPSGGTTTYRFETSENSYDAAAAQAGTRLSELGDDDSTELTLPFRFPFFGQGYRSLFLNSDGNLTFGKGDVQITDRTLGRMLSGVPRIAAQFNDLDPTNARDGVRFFSAPDRVVFSWSQVPEFRDAGNGPLQTFQIRLFPNGLIEIAYLSGVPSEAVVGIAPGKLTGEPALVAFLTGVSSTEYSSSIVERFTNTEAIDIFSAAQKFYRNHDDAYDYLVIYNTMGVSAGDSTVAYEVTVRNSRSGYGDTPAAIGEQAGSKKRLQAILNMGPLQQYPRDPNGRVPARLSVGDTPLSVLAHEAGHLFLAFASVRDARGDEPMLGAQSAHWNFKFNSDASLMEGNRIQDNGASATPRFLTTATVESFSPLDQYLMGFRSPDEVPDSFYVANSRSSAASGLPRTGVAFDGDRVNVSVRDLVAEVGRRTPDHTVAQRQFRLGFMVVTPDGQDPTADQLAQIEAYRAEFEAYFAKVTGQNASAATSLRKGVSVSAFPAVGVLANAGGVPVVVSIEQPASVALNFAVRSRSGLVRVPATVTIPTGATQVSFEISGSAEGADDLILEPTDQQYTSVVSRVQVSAASRLQLQAVSDVSPVRFQVTDLNRLPYPGVTVQARVTGGTVDRASAVTDADGMVQFAWTQSTSAVNALSVSVSGGPTLALTTNAAPLFAANAILNAASYVSGLVPGGIATIFGSNLGGQNAKVFVNGESVQILFGNATQINFVVPQETEPGSTEVVVRAGSAVSASVRTSVNAVQPGIFFNTATNYGAITIAGSGSVTNDNPPAPGEYIAIYATGLGLVRTGGSGLQETVVAPQVTIGGMPADVLYSGLAPGYVGLYQINARVPVGVSAGPVQVSIAAGGVQSNRVLIFVR